VSACPAFIHCRCPTSVGYRQLTDRRSALIRPHAAESATGTGRALLSAAAPTSR
jgi:hypothetical protein